MPIDRRLREWRGLNLAPYDRDDVDPYTRCRVIRINGIEVEAALFSHQFERHRRTCRGERELAMARRIEQQQQKGGELADPRRRRSRSRSATSALRHG